MGGILFVVRQSHTIPRQSLAHLHDSYTFLLSGAGLISLRLEPILVACMDSWMYKSLDKISSFIGASQLPHEEIAGWVCPHSDSPIDLADRFADPGRT